MRNHRLRLRRNAQSPHSSRATRLLGEPLEQRCLLAAVSAGFEALHDLQLPSDVAASPSAASPLAAHALAAVAESETIAWSPARALPAVAADANGNYVVVWSGSTLGGTGDQLGESSGKIFAQRYNAAGQKLGGVIVVAEPLPPDPHGFDDEYTDLKVFMAANGSFVITWDHQSRTTVFFVMDPGPVGQPMARSFDANGQARGSAVQIAPGLSQLESVALSDNGELTIGYMQHQVGLSDNSPSGHWGAYPNLYLKRYSADLSHFGETVALGLGTGLHLVVNGQGVASAVWSQGIYGRDGLAAQQFSRLGNSPGPLVRLNASSAGDLAIDANGTITLAYRVIDANSNSHLYLQRFNANFQAEGQPTQVNRSTGNSIDRISIAMHRDGSFFVVWDITGFIVHEQNSGLIISYPDTLDGNGSLRARSFSSAGNVRSDEFSFGSANASGGAWSRAVRAPGKLVTAWLDGGYFPPAGEGASTRFLVRQVNVAEVVAPTDLTIDLNGAAPSVNFARNFAPGGSPVTIADPNELRISSPTETIASATIAIEDYQNGDTLLTYSHNPNILWSFNAGVLTLTGVDTVSNYEALLKDVWFRTTAARALGTTINLRVTVNNGAQQSPPAYSNVSMSLVGRSTVAGRHIFYNNSKFDGGNPAVNAADDAAIATDKSALPRGHAASFANVSSYSAGINGIMLDLTDSHGQLVADDFRFHMGNSSRPETWDYAPQPISITVRHNQGVGGSDRVEIIWTDGAIRNAWLQVTVLANVNTGLAEADVFSFGSRVGDTASQSEYLKTDTRDALAVINRVLKSPGGYPMAAANDPLDINRDGRINSQDLLTIFNEIGAGNSYLTSLGGSLWQEMAVSEPPPLASSSDGAGIEFSITPTASPLNAPSRREPDRTRQQVEELPYLLEQVAPSLLMEEPES